MDIITRFVESGWDVKIIHRLTKKMRLSIIDIEVIKNDIVFNATGKTIQEAKKL
jgi:hypothetical protein